MARSAPTFAEYIGRAIPSKEDRKARAAFVKSVAETLGVTPRTVQRKITDAGQKRGQGERSKGLTGREKSAANKYIGSVAKRTDTNGLGHNPNAKDRILQIKVTESKERADALAKQQIEAASDESIEDGETPTLLQHAGAVRTRFLPQGSTYMVGWGSRAQVQHVPAGGLWAVEVIGN